MDRALDEMIVDKRRRDNRGTRPPRRQDERQREDPRKYNARGDSTNIDNDWIHDKFEEEPRSRRYDRAPRRDLIDRYSPPRENAPSGHRIRVDNLHYELTEEELEDLFKRIGPITSLSIRYDRAGRSSGTAYVNYLDLRDARQAIREFDGANANGQPIRLTLMPSGPNNTTMARGGGAPGGGPPARNPFDSAVMPARSLFDRIQDGPDMGRERQYERNGSRYRSRSRSPGMARRTNVRKPPPEGVDRYVPGEGRSSSRRERSRSPPPRARGRGARGGVTRGGGPRDGTGRERNGRPRKTQEELDAEMDNYWGSKQEGGGGGEKTANATSEAPGVDEAGDVDMIT